MEENFWSTVDLEILDQTGVACGSADLSFFYLFIYIFYFNLFLLSYGGMFFNINNQVMLENP